MRNKGKKICPLCNYLGRDDAQACPHCDVPLISECPNCSSRINTAFAKYCSICGYRFAAHSIGSPEKETRREKSTPGSKDCKQKNHQSSSSAEKQRRKQ